MLIERSRSLLRVLLVLSLCMSVLALGFASRNAGALADGTVRADVTQKALRLQPGFQGLCANLRATLPPAANVLLEPSRLDRTGVSPQARWHLAFNYELSPLRCYTREPAAASGTLVDWPRWVERHFPGAAFAPEQALEPISNDEFERALEERRIGWRITFPQAAQFALSEVRVWRRESGLWKPVELVSAPPPEPARPLRSLGTALAVALALLLAGSGLLRALGWQSRGDWIAGVSDGLAAGLALGACAVLGWCWLRDSAVSVTSGRACLGLLAGGGLVGWWIAKRRATRTTPARATDEVEAQCSCTPWTVPERLLAVVCAFFCAYALLQAYGIPLHRFDSTQHFAYKARLLLSEGLGGAGWSDLEGPVGRIVTHPSYPPLLGALTALCSCVRGAFDADAGKLLAALFLPLGALWLFRGLRSRSRMAALVAAASWSGLPFLYYAWTGSRAGGAFDWLGLLCGPELAASFGLDGYKQPFFSDLLDGTGDLPLAALTLGTLLALDRMCAARDSGSPRNGNAATVALLGLLAAATLLVKNEGLPLLALLVGGAVLRERLALPFARLGGALAVASLCCVPWWLAKQGIPAIDEDYGALLRPAHVLASLERAGVVATEYASAWARVLRWNLLWPICALALLAMLGAARATRRDLLVPAFALVGALALYFVVLLVTPWGLPLLFSTFIPDRLFVHVAPLAILLATTAAWSTKEERA